ncbi:MAG: MFS transporter [Propionibacteriaceae bacterium]|jgi:DHA3 family macrolide efflux protein-like MFS transporter|nr:MFS transporter [Propionibacteriaceae bacterium]
MSEQATAELAASGSPLPANWLAVIAFIWGGQAMSIITSYAAGYAAIWYITETTGSAMMLSIAAIVSVLPTGLLSPFGGVLADRFNRRTIMLVSDASVGLLSAVLGVIIWLGQTNLPIIMVVLGARAIAQAFHSPAMTAAMPMLVPDKHLLRINSLSQLLWSVAGIGSPVLGIFLYTTMGLEAVMFLDAGGAVLACVGLILVSIPTVRDADMDGKHILANMADGFRAIQRNRGLFTLMGICTVAMIIYLPFGSLFPLMVQQHFHGDGYMAAMSEATFAVAMLIGSLVLMAWGGGRRHVVLVILAGFISGLVGLFSGMLTSDMFWIFLVLTAIWGFVVAFYGGPLMTIIQRNSSNEKMGRVMGLFNAVSLLASPIGLAIAGVVAEGTGIARWYLISGVLLCGISVVGLFFPAVMALDRTASEADKTPDENVAQS